MKLENATDEQLQKELKRRVELNRIQTARSKLTCISSCYGEGCGKQTAINKLIYIKCYYWDGEAGVDTWIETEGKFKCPKCGRMNRMFYRNKRETARLELSKNGVSYIQGLFASTTEEYKE